MGLMMWLYKLLPTCSYFYIFFLLFNLNVSFFTLVFGSEYTGRSSLFQSVSSFCQHALGLNPKREQIYLPNILIRENSTDMESSLFDIEHNNVTIVLAGMQLSEKGPLMYCLSGSPFDPNCSSSNSVRAYSKMTFNDDGRGSGSCDSGGNGRKSRGMLDPYHYHINLTQVVDFSSIRARLVGLELKRFSQINTEDINKPWNITGEAGDIRMYENGNFSIWDDVRTLITAESVKWYQNMSYPSPIGKGDPEFPSIVGYFVGKIVELASDEGWVEALDPYGTGYLLGVVRAAAFGRRECFATASFWITLRGFPDLGEGTFRSKFIQENTADTGAKVGPYYVTRIGNVKRAEKYANNTVTIASTTVGVAVASSLAIAVSTATLPALSAAATVSMPGNGASRTIRNAAFIARLTQIRGFHAESRKQYGRNTNAFLVKFPYPFGKSESKDSSGALSKKGNSTVRQNENDDEEDEDEPAITDDIFKGCAFYTLLIVSSVLLIHLVIWLFTRRRPIEEQVTPHAWMVYIFSLVMDYIHTSSILNAFQYIRTHWGMGTGKPILYFIAFLQLTLIGFGFIIFFIVVILLASRRLRTKNVNWIPKGKHPDPEMRRSAVVAGEYQAEDDNFFHGVFEGYYSGLAGPRIWIAIVELLVGFIDTVATALIWDELVVLSIFVCIYGLLFILFVIFGPFVDTIEGRLVTSLGFVDLILLFLEFLGALGNYETADILGNISDTFGMLSVGISSIITLYCDIIPISQTCWEWIKPYAFIVMRKVGLVVPVIDESWSGWSMFSKSDVELDRNRSIESGSGSRAISGDEEDRKYEFAFNAIPSWWRKRRPTPWYGRFAQQNSYHGDNSSGTSGSVSVSVTALTRRIIPDEEAIAEPSHWWTRGHTVESIWNLRNGQVEALGSEHSSDML